MSSFMMWVCVFSTSRRLKYNPVIDLRIVQSFANLCLDPVPDNVEPVLLLVTSYDCAV